VFSGPNGAVGAPAFTFTSDTDSGMYRIGANNIGLGVNGAKVLDVATTGLSVTGALSATGKLSNSLARTSTYQANYHDITGNMRLATNTIIGSSGGGYPYIGYNARATSTTNQYEYDANDSAALLQFGTGAAAGFYFKYAGSGTAGNTMSDSTYGSINSSGLWTIGASGGGQTHVVNGNINSISTGINLLVQSNTTDATTKNSRFGNAHYTNSEEPMALIHGESTSSVNGVYIGGGTSAMNAATTIQFYTAANNTTTSGTLRGSIDTNGLWTIGASGGGQTHAVNGNLDLTGGIVGTITNDSATAGHVGEYLVDSQPVAQNVPNATAQFGDTDCQLSITAGDWDVTGVLTYTLNGSTPTQFFKAGISSTSGDSSTGLVEGDTLVSGPNPASGINPTLVIPNVRVSVSGTTTYYLKTYNQYSAGNPQYYCRLSARRVR
jgi:hypothetical protein